MSAQPSAPPLLFDRVRLARRRDACAAGFGDYAFLKARVSSALIDRLKDSPRRFSQALDLGGHTGGLATLLQGYAPVSAVVTSDISPAMVAHAQASGLQAMVVDEEALPFDAGRFDLVVSALSLHWVNDLPGTLVQIRRALKPDGLFLGALFAAGTLAELRECLMLAETEICGGMAPRVSPLPGLKDLAALLQRAGFALPVADRDTVTVRYESILALLDDLKGMGERAAFARGMGQPLPRRVLRRAGELYAQRFSDADGRVRASFEIVYLSGWAPAPGQPRPLRPGSASTHMGEALDAFAKEKDQQS